MEIRPDLKQESQLLSRLAQYATVFRGYNFEDWPHLKNKEDFRRVYDLPWEQRGPLEEIYGTGRDLAVFMSGRLVAFNDPGFFPTLKSFVDSFAGGWIDQIEILNRMSREAKEIAHKLDSPPWAVGRMIRLFDEQIELVKATRQAIEGLKQSTTYQWESDRTQSVIHTTAYEKILECINIIGKMFERLPSTYADKEEEHLRDHILVTLGAAVLGSTTGETFNKRGKTDILVRSAAGGNNEFVGECKFWRGESIYLATIDQLLDYLGWRDNKAAVILFVPNKGFSSVLKTIRDSTCNHPNFVRFVSEQDESWLNYEFKLRDDPDRVIKVAIMAYHMPPMP
ncbi:hypothetical protein BGV68_32240 [Burkholderia ubonensis]|uniref:hypothetical protein n=1 Tax=Burkholderia TaxID=32008 RepID=UPI0008FE7A80|nr:MULTISPECIES: hypothetical protein [Burkholderia]MBN3737575.1 hypothetical protein [Burkholderia sp. Tr-20355]OJA44753.1 hypothetical protein BGV68_32240 [Burkholderia ubonensis]